MQRAFAHRGRPPSIASLDLGPEPTDRPPDPYDSIQSPGQSFSSDGRSDHVADPHDDPMVVNETLRFFAWDHGARYNLSGQATWARTSLLFSDYDSNSDYNSDAKSDSRSAISIPTDHGSHNGDR